MTIPSLRPRRKALLVGIREVKKVFATPVPGAHRDTKSFRDLLLQEYDYQHEDIVTLNDCPKLSADHPLWPNRDNILREMENLVRDASFGDILVFLFSGHGGQIRALEDPNEKDGLDEILFPADAYTISSALDIPYVNYIKDDEIKSIFTALPAGCRCVMIFDCCHSGTAGDLPDVLDDVPPSSVLRSPTASTSSGFAKMQTIHSASAVASNGLSRNDFKLDGSADLALPSPVPDLSSWSACEDAYETIGNSKGGVFLRAFCQALRKDPRPTHAQLLHNLQTEIENMLANVRPELRRGLSGVPIPQLGSLRPHEVLRKKFIL